MPFFAPSEKVVGGPNGDSRDKGAAVRLVPRCDTHLKSGTWVYQTIIKLYFNKYLAIKPASYIVWSMLEIYLL